MAGRLKFCGMEDRRLWPKICCGSWLPEAIKANMWHEREKCCMAYGRLPAPAHLGSEYFSLGIHSRVLVYLISVNYRTKKIV